MKSPNASNPENSDGDSFRVSVDVSDSPFGRADTVDKAVQAVRGEFPDYDALPSLK